MVVHGSASGQGPHQLIGADGIAARYDAAGNLVDLRVERSGRCLAGSKSYCAQRFVYEWDEVGSLMRARRWDYEGASIPLGEPVWPAVPSGTPAADVSYAHSGTEQVRRSASFAGADPVHDLRVFETLRLKNVGFRKANLRYVVPATSVELRLADIARVVYAPSLPSPRGRALHVFLEVKDHLGSPMVVIDRDSAEVTERMSYFPYGAAESHFRPPRWQASSDTAAFTGKVPDGAVGLIHFGARYLQPQLGRWASADPLVVHAPSVESNPYAYVNGRLAATTDPLGLAEDDTSRDEGISNCPGEDFCTRYSAPPKTPRLEEPDTPPPRPYNGMNNWFDRLILQSDNAVARFLQDDRRLASLQQNIGLGTLAAEVELATGGSATAAAMAFTDSAISDISPESSVALGAAAMLSPKRGLTGGATLALNFFNGYTFESAVFKAAGLTKNTRAFATTVNGKLVTTIPDAIPHHLVELKNVLFVRNTSQIQGQAQIATEAGVALNIVVSNRTRGISQKVVDAVTKTGGVVVMFDENVNLFTQVRNATRGWIPIATVPIP